MQGNITAIERLRQHIAIRRMGFDSIAHAQEVFEERTRIRISKMDLKRWLEK